MPRSDIVNPILLDYIEVSKRRSQMEKSRGKSDSLKDIWNDAVNRYGLIGTILLLPFYLCFQAIGIVFILVGLWLALFYIPAFLILGITIDVFRQIIHRIKKREGRFFAWKYTDKALKEFYITPHGMSLGGYERYKEQVKKYGKDYVKTQALRGIQERFAS